MTNKKYYQAPELELLPMLYDSLLCESNTGDVPDYDLVDGFTW